VFKEINEATRVNGFSRVERKQMFGEAMGRAKNFWYDMFFDALESDDFGNAEKALSALISLGTADEDMEASMTRRNLVADENFEDVRETASRLRERGHDMIHRTSVTDWFNLIGSDALLRRPALQEGDQ